MKTQDTYQYREMLLAIQAGDQRAFSAFYDLFSVDLMRFINKKIDDRKVAEDILHDLFLSVWDNRARIDKIESIAAYLYSSCRYLILAEYRKNAKRGIQLPAAEIVLENPETSIEDRLYYRHILDVVHQEIENLPAKCREVFVLSREAYLSNKEIAIRLNISESTVEKHIIRALRQLREATNQLFHFVLLF